MFLIGYQAITQKKEEVIEVAEEVIEVANDGVVNKNESREITTNHHYMGKNEPVRPVFHAFFMGEFLAKLTDPDPRYLRLDNVALAY